LIYCHHLPFASFCHCHCHALALDDGMVLAGAVVGRGYKELLSIFFNFKF